MGVLSVFGAIAALGIAYVVIGVAYHVIEAWWHRNHPMVLRTTRTRRNSAAAMMLAPAVVVVRIPGNVFLAWRPRVDIGTEGLYAGSVIEKALRAETEPGRPLDGLLPEGSGASH